MLRRASLSSSTTWFKPKTCFTLATTKPWQINKSKKRHCWLSGWVYVLSPRFSSWMKKPKTEQPKCYPQAPKAGPQLWFFPPGRGTKTPKASSSKRLDDETSSTIKYIDTPNIEYMYRFEYIIFTIIYRIVPVLLISVYVILCKYHVRKYTPYLAINPSRLYKSGKV